MNETLKIVVFWTIHGTVCAAPSFLMALTEYDTTPSILGMIAGTLLVIAFYSWMSLPGRIGLFTRQTAFTRAVRIAAHLRAGVSCVYLIGLFTSASNLISPLTLLELYTGFAGIWLSLATFNLIHWPQTLHKSSPVFWFGSAQSFIPTVYTTICTAAVFSIGFVVLVLLCMGLRGVASKLRGG